MPQGVVLQLLYSEGRRSATIERSDQPGTQRLGYGFVMKLIARAAALIVTTSRAKARVV
jgi:hypothetical protein